MPSAFLRQRPSMQHVTEAQSNNGAHLSSKPYVQSHATHRRDTPLNGAPDLHVFSRRPSAANPISSPRSRTDALDPVASDMNQQTRPVVASMRSVVTGLKTAVMGADGGIKQLVSAPFNGRLRLMQSRTLPLAVPTKPVKVLAADFPRYRPSQRWRSQTRCGHCLETCWALSISSPLLKKATHPFRWKVVLSYSFRTTISASCFRTQLFC